MNDLEKMQEAREVIEDAKRTIAVDGLLSADFKKTAEEGLIRILSGLNDGSLPLDRALNLAKSLMEAVLVERRHLEHQSKARLQPYGQMARVA